jgi:hypothetical protein
MIGGGEFHGAATSTNMDDPMERMKAAKRMELRVAYMEVLREKVLD